MSSPETPAELTAAMRKFVEVYKVDRLFADNPDLSATLQHKVICTG